MLKYSIVRAAGYDFEGSRGYGIGIGIDIGGQNVSAAVDLQLLFRNQGREGII